ncbi:MAG: hypothetical protein K2O00_01370 [Muribaculaceae bacterium]|nr:hypothetical protein [Muribaculaceae bacterium]
MVKEIFQPFNAHNMQAKTRLVRSATWENLATPEGGICENSYELYDELAAGGVGTLITGFTSVDANDRYFGGMMRLCDDSLIPEYKRLTEIIKKHDVFVMTQLALGAYYAKGRDGRYSEVDIDYMTTEQIHDAVHKFVEAGRRAAEAGFDGVRFMPHTFSSSAGLYLLPSTIARMSMEARTAIVPVFLWKSSPVSDRWHLRFISPSKSIHRTSCPED